MTFANEVFLLKSKAGAVDSLHNITATVKLGLRIQCLPADKGGQYISKDFKKLCVNSSITVEYTATAAPQQVGVSERDGRTLSTIARCLLKEDGDTATSLTTCGAGCSSRQFFCPTDRRTQRWEERRPSRQGGRYVGSTGNRGWAFVHIETYTTKLGDKAWEGTLCGFSQSPLVGR